MLCGCGNYGTVNRPFLGGTRNIAKKYGNAKNPFVQWVLRLPLCLPAVLPRTSPDSQCSASWLLLLVVFVSLPSALRLVSFPLVVHFALCVTPMQGTSYTADQPVGGLLLVQASSEPFSCGQRCGIAWRKTQESRGYDRLSAWSKKRMISGKRLSALFLVTSPTKPS